ncbi:MAG: serine/threonine protein kinase [Planctomycetota bacterium]|nr:MAG: serine/threonine protein kinase [Planctomycetota bacterium]
MERVKKELQYLEEELFLRNRNPVVIDTWTSIEELNRMITTATGETYELLQKKEGGTFGIVYKGRDRKLNRLVALKILRSEFLQNREVVLRFQREAQAMSLIRHPNVVEVYAVGEIEGLPFFVMPFVGEEDLEKLIQKETFLPPQKALSIGYYIAKGLEAAHQAKVIHRDLKPANILLSEKEMPVITDFGVAYISHGERLTDAPSIMGTFLYLSPEQADGLQADERSDLYSLGVILYEMLTGSPPYVDENPIQLLRKIIELPPPPMSEWGIAIPDEVEDFVRKLLSKKPENRLPSAKMTAKILKKLAISLS